MVILISLVALAAGKFLPFPRCFRLACYKTPKLNQACFIRSIAMSSNRSRAATTE